MSQNHTRMYDRSVQIDWLTMVCRETDTTPTQLARDAGLDRSTLTKFLRPEAKHFLTARTIEKIVSVTKLGPPPFSVEYTEPIDSLVAAPLISWVQAGQMVDISDPYPRGGSEGAVHIDFHRDTVLALRVKGDSMNRVAPPGSMIVYDYEDRVLVDGKFYIVRHEDTATFKKYRAGDNPRFVPFSHNPDHDDVLPQDQMEVLGRVIRVVIEI